MLGVARVGGRTLGEGGEVGCRDGRGELGVAPDERVRDREQLAVHVGRRVGQPDGVVERLRHLLDAVGPFEDRQRQADLRRLAGRLLERAAHEEVERLVRAAELDVGLEVDRVLALGERVEELVERDRLAAAVAVLEVVALQHPRDGHVRGQADDVGEGHRAEPVAVVDDGELLGARVEHERGLLEVGLPVGAGLVARQRRPRLALARRVADGRREVADDEDGAVAGVLELAQLAQHDRVAEVEVRPARVAAELDEQRHARRGARLRGGREAARGQGVGDAAHEVGEGRLGSRHRSRWVSRRSRPCGRGRACAWSRARRWRRACRGTSCPCRARSRPWRGRP